MPSSFSAPAEVATRIRDHLRSFGAEPGAEVTFEELEEALPEYGLSSIKDGVTRGVIEGWWLNGPLGRIVLTEAGAAE